MAISRSLLNGSNRLLYYLLNFMHIMSKITYTQQTNIIKNLIITLLIIIYIYILIYNIYIYINFNINHFSMNF